MYILVASMLLSVTLDAPIWRRSTYTRASILLLGLCGDVVNDTNTNDEIRPVDPVDIEQQNEIMI